MEKLPDEFISDCNRDDFEKALRSHFERYGKVTNVFVLRKSDSYPTRAALVSYETVDEALCAMSKQHSCSGNTLTLRFNYVPEAREVIRSALESGTFLALKEAGQARR